MATVATIQDTKLLLWQTGDGVYWRFFYFSIRKRCQILFLQIFQNWQLRIQNFFTKTRRDQTRNCFQNKADINTF